MQRQQHGNDVRLQAVGCDFPRVSHKQTVESRDTVTAALPSVSKKDPPRTVFACACSTDVAIARACPSSVMSHTRALRSGDSRAAVPRRTLPPISARPVGCRGRCSLRTALAGARLPRAQRARFGEARMGSSPAVFTDAQHRVPADGQPVDHVVVLQEFARLLQCTVTPPIPHANRAGVAS